MLAGWKIALIVISVVIVVGLALGLGLYFGLRSTSTENSNEITPTPTPTITPSPVPGIIESDYVYVPYIVSVPANDAFIMIINNDTNIPERSISLANGSFPLQVVLAPDLKTAYVCQAGLNSIGILDITHPDTVSGLSGSIDLTSSLLPGQSPVVGVITPDGKWLYIGTSGNPARVIQIQLSDNTVTKLLDNGPDFYKIPSIIVNPLGTMLYVANETTSRGFVPIDIADPQNPIIKPFVVVPTVGSQEMNNLVMSYDGLFIYIIPNNIVDPNVYQYNIVTEVLNESSSTIASGMNINYIAISPDNTTLYAVSGAANPDSCNLFTIDITNNYDSTFVPMYVPASGTDTSSSVQANSNLLLTTGFNLSSGDGKINRFNTSSVPLVLPITSPSNAFFFAASPLRIFGQI